MTDCLLKCPARNLLSYDTILECFALKVEESQSEREQSDWGGDCKCAEAPSPRSVSQNAFDRKRSGKRRANER